ncbi:uncharacterized protein Z519_00681 [Cladophialophora bantiana CBS 173.52]|uniref:Uncharacterized protein n=1 Tax=Cladophialophora bantiana (strain ATCC 10958 / CBS 173.52 / CDC B-1940 / NIH 8579) TaxID=1442370 RepID=A0A0D2I009_CLAB1|nr:uncharacterized protein Z519_00681 [Cladophialophora bantiana CBS 173.52]KIW99018.1 hypothetical protein Z519_00681 [Cladophialophora bantiana CBS 173.52]
MPCNPPFPGSDALDNHPLRTGPTTSSSTALEHVPDQPNVALTQNDVARFLEDELNTAILDRMYPWLWLCTAMDSARIDALHKQIVKRRTIIASEDAALHLVWYRSDMFVKPIPPALFNYEFWKEYLNGQPQQFDRRVVLGFLRSYGYLIRHRTDLRLAIKEGLVPENIDWLQWERFIAPFRLLEDDEVGLRYHAGQLRLSRLNILIRILRPREDGDVGTNRHYHQTQWYTASYMRQFAGPLLFIFASVSLLLSAMQVVLTLPSDPPWHTWVVHSASIADAFWGFSVTVLVALAFSWLLLIGGPIVYLIAQQVFGYRQKCKFQRRLAP